MMRRCSACGQRRVDDPIIEAARRVQLARWRLGRPIEVGDRAIEERAVDRAIARIASELDQLRAEVAASRRAAQDPAGRASAPDAPPAPSTIRPTEWTPPSVVPAPPPPDLRALAAGAARRTDLRDPGSGSSSRWRTPLPDDLRALRRRLDVDGEHDRPAPQRARLGLRRTERTAGHGLACVCADCCTR